MIDLSVMHPLALGIYILTGLIHQGLTLQEPKIAISVSNLRAGDVLQGIYPIQGNFGTDNFSSYDISFTYNDDQTGTWFLISRGEQPVNDSLLAIWDTTQITDGNYNLRVLVTFNDGSTQELVVNDILVRNYTPLTPIQETSEPAVANPSPFTAISSETPAQITASITPFSANPGSLSQGEFQGALTRGVGGSIGIFVLIGLYFIFRKLPRRR